MALTDSVGNHSWVRVVGLNQLKLLCFREAQAALSAFTTELLRKTLTSSISQAASALQVLAPVFLALYLHKNPHGWGGAR